VYTTAWSGEHRAFIVEEFIRNGGSPVASALRSVDGRLLTPCDFFFWAYLNAKVCEQRPLTLEALKEAIRQVVAAITPEMILKVTDNYRETLHQFINIQGRHLSDVLFKTRRCKTAFCVFSKNKKKTFAVSSLVSNLLASQIGEFFLLHPVLKTSKFSVGVKHCWLSQSMASQEMGTGMYCFINIVCANC